MPRAVATQAPEDGLSEIARDAAGVRARIDSTNPVEETIQIAGRPLRAMRIPGYGDEITAGRPVLPVRRFLIDVPEGVGVTLQFEAAGVSTIATGILDPAPDPVEREPFEVPIPGGRVAGEDEEMPAVKLLFIGNFGRRRVAVIEHRPVAPGGSGLITFIRQTFITLTFYSGTTSTAHPPPTHTPPLHAGPFTTTAALASFPQPQWRLKIEVDARGIYKITPADFTAAGIAAASVLPKRLVLTNGGQIHAILVEGEADGIFHSNDRILFYGEPVQSIYTKKNAYFLEQLSVDAVDALGPDVRIRNTDCTLNAQINPAPYFRQPARFEINSIYWQLLPNGAGKDHWFWKKTLAPSTNAYSLDLYDPAIPGSGSFTLRTALHGYTDTLQNPDHHTRVRLNGTQVADSTWNGIVPLTHVAQVPSGLFVNGANTATVEQVADTGAIVDGIYTDYFELEYDRYFVSINDELAFPYPGAQASTFNVRKFSAPDVYGFDVSDPARVRRLVNGSYVGTTQFMIQLTVPPSAAATASYHFAGPGALRTPVSITKPAPRFAPPAAGADWIVIAPKSFESSLNPLIAHRASTGLRVCFASVEQITDQYGSGVFGIHGIHNFLKDAWQNWSAPSVKNVLLVGDANVDGLYYIGNGIANLLPAPMKQVAADGEVPSDHYYACLSGDDPLPEINVGRIPAATAAEVQTVVQKIIARETAPPLGAWKTTVSHVADKGAEFSNALNALGSQYVPPAFTVKKVYGDTFPSVSATRTAVIAELNAGASIVTYLGHGSFVNWSGNLLLTDAAALVNGARTPLIIALSCTNGYFASPNALHGMAETLILNPTGGAVGCFASTGLGFLSQLIPIANFAYTRAFAGQSMGDVTTGGKVDAWVIAGIPEDNLWQSILIGDPAGGVLP